MRARRTAEPAHDFRASGPSRPSVPGVRLDAQQRVVRIEVIHVVARDDVVLHEHGGRHRPAAEDAERSGESGRRRSAPGNSPTDAISGVRGWRSSARASGSAFWPTMAQVSARPASWNARVAPSALGSFAAATRMRSAFDSRRCLRTRSSAVLNCPSPSIETTASCAVSCATSRMPGEHAAHARGGDRARRARARAAGSRGPGRSTAASRIAPGDARPSTPPRSCWRRNTWRRDAECRSRPSECSPRGTARQSAAPRLRRSGTR